jgi:histidyl-tRNA synthetase
MGFMDARRDTGARRLRRLRDLVGARAIGLEGVAELETIAALLDAQGYGPDRIVIDPSVVRGLGYYTGPVFEAELTFEILDEKGRKRSSARSRAAGAMTIWSSASPGRRCRRRAFPSGWTACWPPCAPRGAWGAERPGPVVVTVMDRDRMADYMAMAASCAARHPRRGLSGQPQEFGNQLKYADKRASPVAVIQGGDEAARAWCRSRT